MFDFAYRLWLLKYLAGVFVPPSALVFVTVHGLEALDIGPHLGWAPQTLLSLACTPVCWLIVRQVTEWSDARKAKSVGATLVPILRGKRFGDVDLVQR